MGPSRAERRIAGNFDQTGCPVKRGMSYQFILFSAFSVISAVKVFLSSSARNNCKIKHIHHAESVININGTTAHEVFRVLNCEFVSIVALLLGEVHGFFGTALRPEVL